MTDTHNAHANTHANTHTNAPKLAVNLNPVPASAPVADPHAIHTLAEFAPAKEELRGPPNLIPVGFWHPTPRFHTYLRNRLALDIAECERLKRPGAFSNRIPPVDAAEVERTRRDLQRAESLPWPRAHTNTLSEHNTAAIVRYITRETHYWATFCGYSACRLCGKWDNGDATVDDGVYAWPSGLAHYVVDHGVSVPIEFAEHALAGGSPPVLGTLTGWVALRDGDDVSELVGRQPQHQIQASPTSVANRVESIFANAGGPIWDYYAVPVEATVTNGRISEVVEIGARVLAVRAADYAG